MADVDYEAIQLAIYGVDHVACRLRRDESFVDSFLDAVKDALAEQKKAD